MPVYSYKCKDCGTQFDLLVGVTSKKTKKVCSKCGSKNIEKIFVSFGVGKSPKGGSSSSGSCTTGTCPFG